MQLYGTKFRISFILSTKKWIMCFPGKNPVNLRGKSEDITKCWLPTHTYHRKQKVLRMKLFLCLPPLPLPLRVHTDTLTFIHKLQICNLPLSLWHCPPPRALSPAHMISLETVHKWALYQLNFFVERSILTFIWLACAVAYHRDQGHVKWKWGAPCLYSSGWLFVLLCGISYLPSGVYESNPFKDFMRYTLIKV